jgi:hypothetical protein
MSKGDTLDKTIAFLQKREGIDKVLRHWLRNILVGAAEVPGFLLPDLAAPACAAAAAAAAAVVRP